MFNNLSRRKFLTMTGGLVAAATITPLPSYAASPLIPDKIDRKRLLLVDDDPDFNLLIKEYLEFRGYDEVMTAENGREALEVLKQDTPDLIISDIRMPEMDGYCFINMIRQDVRTCSIPFMFLSCKDQSQDIVKGLNLGADAYMTKPFEPEQLVAQIGALIRQSHRSPSSKISSVPKRLLLVGNDPILITLVKEYLEFRGYDEVMTAENGREALEISDLALPDLIVSGVMMPYMNGHALVKHIRQNKRTRSTPFLFASAMGQSQDIVKGLNLGADAYMVIPFELEQLVAQIEALIRQSHRPRSRKTSFVNTVVL